MKLGIALLIIGIAVAAPGVVRYGAEFSAVDACLDAGGSFDYARMQCDRLRDHPYVSFTLRHPNVMHSVRSGGTLAAMGLVLVALGLARSRMRQARQARG